LLLSSVLWLLWVVLTSGGDGGRANKGEVN
jgi:hypothetical protein